VNVSLVTAITQRLKVTQMSNDIRIYMRPFITVMFVLLTTYLTVLGKVDAKDVLLVTTSLVSYWFGERSNMKDKDKN
jgi:hypothetical protein